MKNLKDVLEKLSIDSITFENFPINGTIDDMIEFLKDYGFVAANEDDNKTIWEILDYNKSKCFLKENMRFWFADTSKEKISKSNPIFYISKSSKIFNVYYVDYWGYTKDIVRNNREEFLEELNKQFGWE